MKISNPEYLAKVQLLTDEEKERLFSRMGGKLPHRLQKDKLSKDEALAIQMELEDEQLQEWRERMHGFKAKTKDLPATKEPVDEAKSTDKPKSKGSKKAVSKTAKSEA
jgi:hypothetical protein